MGSRIWHDVAAAFRKHYTSFFPGLETKDVTGKDLGESMQVCRQLAKGDEGLQELLAIAVRSTDRFDKCSKEQMAVHER